jgi:hypothetical protein
MRPQSSQDVSRFPILQSKQRVDFSAKILSKQEMRVEAEAETELVDADQRGLKPALRVSEDATRDNASNLVPASNMPDFASKLLEASVHELLSFFRI